MVTTGHLQRGPCLKDSTVSMWTAAGTGSENKQLIAQLHFDT